MLIISWPTKTRLNQSVFGRFFTSNTSNIFAIFRKIFVGIHFWYMPWMRLVHRYTMIFFKTFCWKTCLKTDFEIFTFLDTTGVTLDRNLSHVGQSHYGQKKSKKSEKIQGYRAWHAYITYKIWLFFKEEILHQGTLPHLADFWWSSYFAPFNPSNITPLQ